jgi:8-oxo-dGTP pyrophosphatase MutT (NUDIX family)
MLRTENAADRFRWLYDDIEKEGVCLIGGERHSQVVGVFVSDGQRLLLERDPALGPEYAFGGQVSADEDPHVAALREIAEETSLPGSPDRLELIDTDYVISEGSPKLPNVRAPRRIHHFLYRVDRFEAVPGQMTGIYEGRDGATHDLLLLPLEEALAHQEVKEHYKKALTAYLDVIAASRAKGRP